MPTLYPFYLIFLYFLNSFKFFAIRYLNDLKNILISVFEIISFIVLIGYLYTQSLINNLENNC